MASTAAAVIAVARRRIVSRFMSQNAVSAADAVTFEPERQAQRRQFARMRDAGVIEETADGRYWLNVPAYDRWQGRVRKRVGAALGLVAVLGGLVAVFG